MYWDAERLKLAGKTDDELRKLAAKTAAEELHLEIEVSIRQPHDWNSPYTKRKIDVTAPASVLRAFGGMSKSVSDMVSEVATEAEAVTAQYLFDDLLEARAKARGESSDEDESDS